MHTTRILAALLLSAGLGTPLWAGGGFWDTGDAYLGQTPPSDTPQVFAPGMLVEPGTIAMDRIAISPDGREIIYNQNDTWGNMDHAKTKGFRFDGRKWVGPTLLGERVGTPTFSMDGKTLFVTTGNPYEVWQLTRTADGWSQPSKYLGEPFPMYDIMPTLGGSFFVGTLPDKDDAKMGRYAVFAEMSLSGGKASTRSLGAPANGPGFNGDFFVARDASFMLVSAKENSAYECEIDITYRKPDGTWTNPKSLGPLINAGVAHRWGEFVTPDNKYLFYSHGTSPKDCALYWVRFDTLLDRLRHTNFEPYVRNPVADQSVPAGGLFSLPCGDATFFDDDGTETLTYAAASANGGPLPDWLHFDPSRRSFTGVAPLGAAYYRIALTATDTAGATAVCRFPLAVLSGEAEPGAATTHDYAKIERSDWVIPETGVLGYAFEPYNGAPALVLKRNALDAKGASIAYPRDFRFRDGTIEFDAASPGGEAGYLGLAFRIGDDHHYETLYFRPGSSDTLNAVQYMPEKKDAFDWWDYEDLKYQAAATLPLKEWFHVKVVVKGTTLAAFVGSMSKPVFIYDELDPELPEGSVGFWLGNSTSGAFRNLVVKTAPR